MRFSLSLIFSLTLSLSLSLRLKEVVGQGSPAGISSPGNPVNPPVTPASGPYTENVIIPNNVLQCSDADLVPDSSNTWSYTQIAKAYYRYGVAPWNYPSASNPQAHIGDCIAALTIVSGECSPNPNPSLGCLTSTGPSGVFQTDFVRTIPGYQATNPNYMNLCTTAFAAGYMTAPFPASATQSCTISIGSSAPASIYTCMQAPSTVNAYGATCQDPASVSGTTYSNFIGPFCHKSYDQRYSPCTNTGPGCCANWNGGGNAGQPAFPGYYFAKAATVGIDVITNACTVAAGSTGVSTTTAAVSPSSTVSPQTSSAPSASSPVNPTNPVKTLSPANSKFDINYKGNIVGYWGQNSLSFSGGTEGSLASYCINSIFTVINLSFMYIFGNGQTPNTNFAFHCETANPQGILICPQIQQDILTCQSLGKIVILSMGGASGAYSLSSAADASNTATQIWNMFLGGSSSTRPFGNSVLDGVDLDIEGGSPANYATFVNSLRTLFLNDNTKTYYVSGAPQCPFPDAYLGPGPQTALSSSSFDWINLQFYNNFCGVSSFGQNLNGGFNFNQWSTWAAGNDPTYQTGNKNIKLFIGVPGSTASASPSSFVSPQTVSNIVTSVSSNNNFGGVMIWDVGSASLNSFGTTLAQLIRSSLGPVPGGGGGTGTITSAVPATTTTPLSTTPPVVYTTLRPNPVTAQPTSPSNPSSNNGYCSGASGSLGCPVQCGQTWTICSGGSPAFPPMATAPGTYCYQGAIVGVSMCPNGPATVTTNAPTPPPTPSSPITKSPAVTTKPPVITNIPTVTYAPPSSTSSNPFGQLLMAYYSGVGIETLASSGVNSLAFAFADPTMLISASANGCTAASNCLPAAFISMMTSAVTSGLSSLTANLVGGSKPVVLISFGGQSYGGAGWDSLFSSSTSASLAGTNAANLAQAVASLMNNQVFVGVDLDVEGMATTLPYIGSFITSYRAVLSYNLSPLQLCTLSGIASPGSSDNFKINIMTNYGPAQQGINFLNLMVNNVPSSCDLMSGYWRAPALNFLPPQNKVVGIWGVNQPTLLLFEPGCTSSSMLYSWMQSNAVNIGIWELWAGDVGALGSFIKSIKANGNSNQPGASTTALPTTAAVQPTSITAQPTTQMVSTQQQTSSTTQVPSTVTVAPTTSTVITPGPSFNPSSKYGRLGTAVKAIYIDYLGINYNNPVQTIMDAVNSGYNMIIICFWMYAQVADMAYVWAGMTQAQQAQAINYAHSKGAVILAAAAGATEVPYNTVSGTAYGTAFGTWAKNNNLDGVCFDVENFAVGLTSPPLTGTQIVSWIVQATQAAKNILGSNSYITHAPQAPYFGPLNGDSNTYWAGATGGYTSVELQTAGIIDYYLVQFYNQGVSCYTSYTGLFVSSGGSCPVFPGTSVLEINSYGIPLYKIVDGKVLTPASASNGFVDPTTLGSLHVTAYQQIGWSAGVAVWLFTGQASSSPFIVSSWPPAMGAGNGGTNSGPVPTTPVVLPTIPVIPTTSPAVTTASITSSSSNNGGGSGSGSGQCVGVAPWNTPSMASWCIANCAVGFCPADHCSCSSGSGSKTTSPPNNNNSPTGAASALVNVPYRPVCTPLITKGGETLTSLSIIYYNKNPNVPQVDLSQWLSLNNPPVTSVLQAYQANQPVYPPGDCSLLSVNSNTMGIAPNTNPTTPPDSNGNANGNGTDSTFVGILVGCIVGGVVLLLIVGFLLFRCSAASNKADSTKSRLSTETQIVNV